MNLRLIRHEISVTVSCHFTFKCKKLFACQTRHSDNTGGKEDVIPDVLTMRNKEEVIPDLLTMWNKEEVIPDVLTMWNKEEVIPDVLTIRKVRKKLYRTF